MTKISAQIVADSICNGHRITTMKVTMPRMILAEAKTHRVMKRTDEGLEIYDIPGIGFNDDEMLSRNSASSRAIPFEKMLESVRADPFIPIAWQADHKGMQGSQYITDPDAIDIRRGQWLQAMDRCCSSAWALHNSYSVVGIQEDIPGVTKQICNRLLEPFMWHTVLVTATEWENFFHLRCPQYVLPARPHQTFRSWKDLMKVAMNELRFNQDVIEGMEAMTVLERLQENKGQAEIHMMALAEAMWNARNESTPKELQPGQWHVPFGGAITMREGFDMLKDIMSKLMGEVVGVEVPIEVPLSTAICAQTSYTMVGEDGKVTPSEVLLDIHNSLLVRPHTNRKGVVFGPDDPKHMSPAEHCAQAMTLEEEHSFIKGYLDVLNPEATYTEDAYGWCHNLRGWKSYRSMILNESRR